MTREQKLNIFKKDIDQCVKISNAIIFWPVTETLKELLKFYKKVNGENSDFNTHIQEVCIQMIQNLIDECNQGDGKDDFWINFTIKQIKEYGINTILKFKRACECFNENDLLKVEI